MQFAIVNLKAYGDFVIACSAVKRIHPDLRMNLPNIIAGEHVRSLASAMDLEQSIKFIGDASWKDVPAVFDVRKRGSLAAVKSILEIRQFLKNLSADTYLIFDRLGLRERWIGHGFYLYPLGDNYENIYIAYDSVFRAMGFQVDDKFSYCRKIERAIIIPGARLFHKIIPTHVIHDYLTELKKRNIEVDIILLEGESIDVPKGVHPIIIPKQFNMLINEIVKSDLVISADSLPSHLSEYLQIPIFVSMQAPNTYWLPRSSYETDGWATFSNIQPFHRWLQKNFHL